MNNKFHILDALYGREAKLIDDIYFNKAAELIEANIDENMLSDIEDVLINELCSKDHVWSIPNNVLPLGTVHLLSIYFRYGSNTKNVNLEKVFAAMRGLLRTEALFAMALIWGPEGQPPKPLMPISLRRMVERLQSIGTEREKLLAALIFSVPQQTAAAAGAGEGG